MRVNFDSRIAPSQPRFVGWVSALHRLGRALRRSVLAVGFLVTASASWGAGMKCLVVGVSDGDTLTARCGSFGAYEQLKIRLSGIDAPEKGQPFGTRSRAALAAMTFGRLAVLDCPKKDRYGRMLCVARVAPTWGPNGPPTIDVGHAMITQGLAWWYRAYARDQTVEARVRYEQAEQVARVKQAGLWSEPRQVPPWECKRSMR
jgi:endonuclease YncB( thermonuclease family)